MVLLIIFMAAAPLLQAGYDIALPRPAAGPSAELITVALDRTAGLRLNGVGFFRQLPAGVPGAYRLFANLLAWK